MGEGKVVLPLTQVAALVYQAMGKSLSHGPSMFWRG